MKRAKELGCIFAALCLLLAGCATLGSREQDVPFVTADQLHQMLGSSDLVIVDVRDPVSWSKSDSKVAGAVRIDPSNIDVSSIADYPKDKKYVFYCA